MQYCANTFVSLSPETINIWYLLCRRKGWIGELEIECVATSDSLFTTSWSVCLCMCVCCVLCVWLPCQPSCRAPRASPALCLSSLSTYMKLTVHAYREGVYIWCVSARYCSPSRAAPRRQQLCHGIGVSSGDVQNDRWHRWLLSLAADFRSLPSWRLDAPATAWCDEALKQIDMLNYRRQSIHSKHRCQNAVSAMSGSRGKRAPSQLVSRSQKSDMKSGIQGDRDCDATSRSAMSTLEPGTAVIGSCSQPAGAQIEFAGGEMGCQTSTQQWKARLWRQPLTSHFLGKSLCCWGAISCLKHV